MPKDCKKEKRVPDATFPIALYQAEATDPATIPTEPKPRMMGTLNTRATTAPIPIANIPLFSKNWQYSS